MRTLSKRGLSTVSGGYRELAAYIESDLTADPTVCSPPLPEPVEHPATDGPCPPDPGPEYL